MLTFLTALTLGMVMTLVMVMARDDASATPADTRLQRGVRIRVTRQ
jgi:hypothetical protein